MCNDKTKANFFYLLFLCLGECIFRFEKLWRQICHWLFICLCVSFLHILHIIMRKNRPRHYTYFANKLHNKQSPFIDGLSRLYRWGKGKGTEWIVIKRTFLICIKRAWTTTTTTGSIRPNMNGTHSVQKKLYDFLFSVLVCLILRFLFSPDMSLYALYASYTTSMWLSVFIVQVGWEWAHCAENDIRDNEIPHSFVHTAQWTPNIICVIPPPSIEETAARYINKFRLW